MAQIFKEIVGHQQTIANLNRSLEQERIAPAYLISGLPGIGRSLIARALAQSVVCEKSKVACGECGACIRIEKQQSEALLEVFPENQKIKIEMAHKISSFFSLQKLSRGRSVIIYGAEFMNPQTANALLKTIEEPPENSHFFMVTSQLGKVLPTIRSRCQVIQLSPLTTDQLRQIVPSAPEWTYHSALGRADILQQLTESDDQVRRQGFVNAFYTAINWQLPLDSVKDWLGDRENTAKLLETWRQLVRDILFCRHQLNPIVHVDQKEQLLKLAKFPDQLWQQLFIQLGQLIQDLEYNVDRQLSLESLLYEFRQQIKQN